MGFSSEVDRSADRAVVHLTGEVDLETSPNLRQTLLDLAADVSTLEADCAGLEFMDSTGLSSLLSAHKAMQEKAGTFVITQAPAMLVKMIRIVGLDRVLNITPR